MDVKEVLLPGVGLRYEFDIEDGERIGVIARRSGDFELVVDTGDDPDQAQPVLRLTDEEADAVANGRALSPAAIDGVYAAHTADGRVIALLRDDGSRTKSVVVIRPATL